MGTRGITSESRAQPKFLPATFHSPSSLFHSTTPPPLEFTLVRPRVIFGLLLSNPLPSFAPEIKGTPSPTPALLVARPANFITTSRSSRRRPGHLPFSPSPPEMENERGLCAFPDKKLEEGIVSWSHFPPGRSFVSSYIYRETRERERIIGIWKNICGIGWVKIRKFVFFFK